MVAWPEWPHLNEAVVVEVSCAYGAVTMAANLPLEQRVAAIGSAAAKSACVACPAVVQPAVTVAKPSTPSVASAAAAAGTTGGKPEARALVTRPGAVVERRHTRHETIRWLKSFTQERLGIQRAAGLEVREHPELFIPPKAQHQVAGGAAAGAGSDDILRAQQAIRASPGGAK